MSARTYNLFRVGRYGNVTVFDRLVQGKPVWVCKLHNTEVLRYCQDQKEVYLNSGGYKTVTTKTAMNAGLKQIRDLAVNRSFVRSWVYQDKFNWYVRTARGVFPFFDGIYINLRTGSVRASTARR